MSFNYFCVLELSSVSADRSGMVASTLVVRICKVPALQYCLAVLIVFCKSFLADRIGTA